jgi:hypothetical protein
MSEERKQPRVTEITFTVVVEGHTHIVTFMRQEKIEELLGAQDTLGSYLTAIAERASTDFKGRVRGKFTSRAPVIPDDPEEEEDGWRAGDWFLYALGLAALIGLGLVLRMFLVAR